MNFVWKNQVEELTCFDLASDVVAWGEEGRNWAIAFPKVFALTGLPICDTYESLKFNNLLKLQFTSLNSGI